MSILTQVKNRQKSQSKPLSKPEKIQSLDELYKNVPVLSDFERHLSIDACVESFNIIEAWTFVGTLYSLGRTVITDRLDTAGVAFVGDEVQLCFNPKFLDWLLEGEANNSQALKTVLAHEALHILLDHKGRMKSRIIELWNIATDIAINRVLEVSGFYFTKLAKMGCFTGEGIGLPKELWDETAEVIYNYIIKNAQFISIEGKSTIDDHDASGKMKNGEGNGKENKDKTDGDGEDEDIKAKRKTEAVKEQMQSEASKASDDIKSKICGDEPLGEMRHIDAVITKYKLSWDQILARRLATEYREFVTENWLPSRKIRNWYPRVVLPSDHEEEDVKKYSVLLALDCSGSIGKDELNIMITLLKELPEKMVDVSAISFDTDAYEIKNTKGLLKGEVKDFEGGGGTDFQCIEDFAIKLEKEKKYPDIVIVLTDGYADRIKPMFPGKWVWVITPGGSDSVPAKSGGEIYHAEEKRG